MSQKKIILLGFILTHLSLILFGQTEYLEVINVNSKANTSEIFFIKKDGNETKEGKYIFKYKGRIQIKGQYYDDNKIGEWTYTPSSNFVIVGSYNNNMKDGEWVYSLNKNVVSVLIYSNGFLDGKQIGYYNNGTIASELNYSKGKQDGVEKRYFVNGEIKEVAYYEDGVLYGENISYSEDGQIISKLLYHKNTPVSLDIQCDKTINSNYSGNLKDGNGCLRTITMIDNRVQVLLERNFKDSLLNGKIVGYNRNGNRILSGHYTNGYMVDKWFFYDASGEINHYKEYLLNQRLKIDSTESLTLNLNKRFLKVDDMAKFENNNQIQFQYYVSKGVRYPQVCLNNGIRGKVYVSFVVNKEGGIEDVNIDKSVHPLIDQEAIRVIKSSPLWTPALIFKIPVKVSYTVPINFDFR